jgi:MFS family permease
MKGSNSSENWVVVAAGFLCLTVAAGIGWYVFPVYLTSIEADLGWSRTQLSLGVGVWALAGAAFSPLIGGWIDRYGARKVMLLGTVCQMVATVLLSRMTALWHLYALFVLSSFANVANTNVPVATVISQWFDEKRGAAMGVALLGMGAGGLVMPILAELFLERYGWRTGYFLFSFFLLALLAPVALWIPDRSERTRDRSGGAVDVPIGADVSVLKGLTVSEAARTRSFWTLAIGDLCIGVVFTSVVVHMVAFTTDAGVSQRAATVAYGAFLGVNTVGILLFGATADKIRLRPLMLLCYGVPALAMALLFRLPSLGFLYVFVIVFGTTGGGRSALWPLALAECFGVRYLGAILGWLNIPFMIGNVVGPSLGGYISDTTGSYRLLYILCIGFSAVSVAFIAQMRREHTGQPPPPAT